MSRESSCFVGAIVALGRLPVDWGYVESDLDSSSQAEFRRRKDHSSSGLLVNLDGGNNTTALNQLHTLYQGFRRIVAGSVDRWWSEVEVAARVSAPMSRQTHPSHIVL
jgi:hypothetical protein